MRTRQWAGVALLGLWAAGLPSAARGQGAAATAEAQDDTVITSTRMSYDYPNRTAVFEGNVVVTDPSVRITSDTLTAQFDTNNAPEVVTAVGNVRIEQEDRVAVCERAVYTVKSGLLVLTGRPVITRGGETLSGARIVFKRDESRVVCEGAKLVIPPSGGKVENVFRP